MEKKIYTYIQISPTDSSNFESINETARLSEIDEKLFKTIDKEVFEEFDYDENFIENKNNKTKQVKQHFDKNELKLSILKLKMFLKESNGRFDKTAIEFFQGVENKIESL